MLADRNKVDDDELVLMLMVGVTVRTEFAQLKQMGTKWVRTRAREASILTFYCCCCPFASSV